MDISYLREFVTLADIRNYTEAADALYISQSSLSKHIAAIEKELGTALFDRSTRRVTLTPAARMLLPYASHIVHLWDSATGNLEDAQGGYQRRTLRIGSMPMMAPYGITKVMHEFSQTHPLVDVDVIEGDNDTLMSALRQGKIELAFMRDAGSHSEEFVRSPFTSDRLVAVLPPTHRLAERAHLELSELDGESFLLIGPGSHTHDICMTACAAAGFVPNVAYTSAHARNIIDLVARDAGVSLMMLRPIERYLTGEVAAVPVVPTVRSTISVYRRRDGELSREAIGFLKSLSGSEMGTAHVLE